MLPRARAGDESRQSRAGDGAAGSDPPAEPRGDGPGAARARRRGRHLDARQQLSRCEAGLARPAEEVLDRDHALALGAGEDELVPAVSPVGHARGRRSLRYDLAILADTESDDAPSDAKALRRFVRAARDLGIDAQTARERDDEDENLEHSGEVCRSSALNSSEA